MGANSSKSNYNIAQENVTKIERNLKRVRKQIKSFQREGPQLKSTINKARRKKDQAESKLRDLPSKLRNAMRKEDDIKMKWSNAALKRNLLRNKAVAASRKNDTTKGNNNNNNQNKTKMPTIELAELTSRANNDMRTRYPRSRLPTRSVRPKMSQRVPSQRQVKPRFIVNHNEYNGFGYDNSNNNMNSSRRSVRFQRRRV